ncbi:MAG: hypothetical protein J5I93_13895 [Pirellulaceae bacterium]|nr:hypothetical protein [Pirellulaceae bacterium]
MAHLVTGGQPESSPAGPADDLPRHDDFDVVTRAIELLSLLAACLLLAWQLPRLAQHGALTAWWTLPLALLAVLAADFISGLVHWFADTWFDESVPVLGPRFLRPFRVHHVNPETFLTRDFVDTNGDVAMLTIPFLLLVFGLPLETAWGQAAGLFLVALSAAALPTNQVHQWAHMARPPRWVAWLQYWGLILSGNAHRRHHEPPHVANYCIATGWCNPVLSAVDFFPRLERLVTRLTGLQPRQDDQQYLERFASAEEERA